MCDLGECLKEVIKELRESGLGDEAIRNSILELVEEAMK